MRKFNNMISAMMVEYREDYNSNKDWWQTKMGVGNNNEYLLIHYKNGDETVITSDFFQFDGETRLPRFRAEEVAYMSRYYGDGIETTVTSDMVVDTDRIIMYDKGVEVSRYDMTEAEYKAMHKEMMEQDEETDLTEWMLDYCRALVGEKKAGNKRITKKAIQSVLRNGDRTAIWKMCYQVLGKRPTQDEVYDFVTEYAPTVKVRLMRFDIAYYGTTRHGSDTKARYDFHCTNARHIAMCKLREEIARGTDNYTKRPIIGKTNLYFASPSFGHDDYNKAYMMPIKGNERFCELICKLADKYIPMSV